MACKSSSIILYSSQRDEVVNIIEKEKEYFVKMKYIKEKYCEVSGVFMNAYEWYCIHADALVPRPKEAESAIWAFKDLRNLEKHVGSKILKLEVPAGEAIFFEMADWNKILNMAYLGSPQKENEYKEKLSNQGVKFESDVVTQPFYPLLKRELYKSWNNLFNSHEKISAGDFGAVKNIQAGLWRIKESWIIH